ncbi:hypothetical protein Bca4012_083338 [Brassica carinata]
MELGGGISKNRWGKAIQSNVLCFCGLEAKIYQAWTNKNPGRRFYGSVLYKCRGACNFFQWYDEGEAFGWQKRALIEARNENRKKDKTIEELKKTIAELRSELVKNEELEEDIINSFLKL